MKVYCPALLSGKYIPNKHAARGVPGGQNLSLPVLWGDVPPGTKSFAISVIDRHPAAKNRVPWFVINVPPSVREISEHASGNRERLPSGALEMRNSFGTLGYDGPVPAKNSGAHEYVITVFALSVESLHVGPFSTVEECRQEMGGKILGNASVVGIFQR